MSTKDELVSTVCIHPAPTVISLYTSPLPFPNFSFAVEEPMEEEFCRYFNMYFEKR